MIKKITAFAATLILFTATTGASSFAEPVKPQKALAQPVKPRELTIQDLMVRPMSRLLTPIELKSVLQEAGFRGKDLVEAWGVAMKESMGRPFAHNKNSHTGDNSYGLFQINMIGSLGPARRDQYNLNTNNDLFVPLTNAKIAFQMSDGGKDWSAWHGITPKTKTFMAQFPR